MKCTACGNENQPGAKFCVHCGIVLVTASAPAWTPVPASAVPAATAAPSPRPAAPAQPAPAPAPSVARAAAATARAPAVPTGAAAAPPESPRKSGLIIAVVAVLVLGAGGYFGYRMLGGEGKERVAVVEPPKPAETAPSPGVSPSVAPAMGASATRDASSTAAPAPSPPMVAPGTATGAEPPKTAAPAATESELPGRPSTAAQGVKAGSGETKAAPSKTFPKAATPGSEAPSKAAPPPSKAMAKAPAVALAPDRWQMMAEAMAQCSPAQFFSRLACEQRTRNRYCEGFWGQAPQCPSAPAKEHGQ